MAIPDEALRNAALESLLIKRRDLEGAVAFAVYARRRSRRKLVQGITAWEIAFDYLDTVSELANPDPITNGQALNQALLTAVTPGASHPDYYARHTRADDGGYLAALVDTCRDALASLPAFDRIIAPAKRGISRIVAYQSLNHGDAHQRLHTPFADWAALQAVRGADLAWWETAAAAGSQLTVLALMTAAANPRLTTEQVEALENAYFPWIGALSTLLDSLIDQTTDRAEGQPNLIDHYRSPERVAKRLGEIAIEAVSRARALPDADHHTLLLGAMAAFFHNQARSPDIRMATRAVLDAMGGTSTPALFIFRLRYGLTAQSRRGTAASPLHHP